MKPSCHKIKHKRFIFFLFNFILLIGPIGGILGCFQSSLSTAPRMKDVSLILWMMHQMPMRNQIFWCMHNFQWPNTELFHHQDVTLAKEHYICRRLHKSRALFVWIISALTETLHTWCSTFCMWEITSCLAFSAIIQNLAFEAFSALFGHENPSW